MSSAPRMSAKTRALTQLQWMRDASRDVFRNLHLTARTGKEEGGTERADMLATNRERLLTVLSQTQSELMESVEELKKHSAHKHRMEVLHKDIEMREAALRQYGAGLQKVEGILCEGLRTASSLGCCGRGAARGTVEVEVDEILRYSHLLSYTTSAKEGWEANTPLVGALPPAPHIGLMARSKLFPGRRKHDDAGEGGKVGVCSMEAGAGSKRPAEMSILRTWKHVQIPDADIEVDEPAKKKHASSNGATGGEIAAARKAQFEVPPMALCVGEHSGKGGSYQSNGAGLGELDVHFVPPTVIVPQKRAKWRPGDPIVIAPER